MSDKDTKTVGLLNGDTATDGGASKMTPADTATDGGASKMDPADTATDGGAAPVDDGATKGKKEGKDTKVKEKKDEENSKLHADLPTNPKVPRMDMEVLQKLVTFTCGKTGKPTYFDLSIKNNSWDVCVFRMKCSYGKKYFRADPHIGVIENGATLIIRLWYANRKRHPAKGRISPEPFFSVVYGPTTNIEDDYEDDSDSDYVVVGLEKDAPKVDPDWKQEDEQMSAEERKENADDPEYQLKAEKYRMNENFKQWQQFSGIDDIIIVPVKFVDTQEEKKANMENFELKKQ